jgi:hypothetical protein
MAEDNPERPFAGNTGRDNLTPMSRKYRRRGAATFVNAARNRTDPAEVEKRLAERERREAADTRTEAQRWVIRRRIALR